MLILVTFWGSGRELGEREGEIKNTHKKRKLVFNIFITKNDVLCEPTFVKGYMYVCMYMYVFAYQHINMLVYICICYA